MTATNPLITNGEVLPIAGAERLLESPAGEWVGRCFEVASRLAPYYGDEAVARYGHYRGPVDPQSRFFGKMLATGFVQHGWIEVGDRIVDPTRFGFGNPGSTVPFLYRTRVTDREYDLGGDRLREQMATPRPVPAGDEIPEPLDFAVGDIVRGLLGRPEGKLTAAEASWIANLPRSSLAPHAAEVYGWLDANDLRALVPIDNWRLVMGEDELE